MSRRRAVAVSAVASAAAPDLGWCPVCGERGETRSQRQGGIDSCTLGHQYPSCDAVRVPPPPQPPQPEGQH
jgi:hypothetical protein